MHLKIESLSKHYQSFASFRERWLCAFSLGLFAGSQKFRALSDLSFTMGQNGLGEILGIVGPNGAGKSTLLRILSGITQATSGQIHFQGSLRSILELGVGFSSDLSGRENIYYNGRLWGYSGRELLAATDQILDFARLRDYADWPLGSYSTGMQMRLAFSLATFQRSDLLLIDEALAVGDASFQQKCVQRFEQFRDQGSLIIVVSHDLPLLQSISDRIMVLDQGRVSYLGDAVSALESYMQGIAADSRKSGSDITQLQGQEFRISLVDKDQQPRSSFFAGEAAQLMIQYQGELQLEDITIGIHIRNRTGVRVFGVNSRQLLGSGLQLNQASKVRFQLKLNLGPGSYSLGMAIHRGLSHAQDCYLWEEQLLDFEMESSIDCAFEGTSYLEPGIVIE